MIYKEERRDLFSVPYEYALCHCISSDLEMGAGIAKKFTELGIKADLKDDQKYDYKIFEWNDCGFVAWSNPDNFRWNGCFSLITKEYYWHKPTLQTLREALEDMKNEIKFIRMECGADVLDKIAMPKIGCGLDKLRWSDVSTIIQDVFKDLDIEILVCYQ